MKNLLVTSTACRNFHVNLIVIFFPGVPLTTMIKFNRLARITVDTNLIAKALKNSDLIQVSEDSTKVRRKPALPLPENSLEYWQDIKKRTVYVVSFKLDLLLIGY